MGEDRAQRNRSTKHEQKTPPQPLRGIQGQGGAGCRQGREDGAEIAQKHDVHPNQVTEWRRQLLERAPDVFGANARPPEPPVDLKVLHAKIGQLTLENDFLEGAPGKAGLRSARR